MPRGCRAAPAPTPARQPSAKTPLMPRLPRRSLPRWSKTLLPSWIASCEFGGLLRALGRFGFLGSRAREHVGQSAVALVACILVQGLDLVPRDGRRPRPRPGGRILDREPVVDAIVGQPRPALDQAHVRAR